MGAGTEKLIYAIVPRVAKTMVTDLYLPNSGWVGVRTDNPRDLILQKAPWPIDANKVDAMAMDMRKLDFPDDSFDFCWSTGSFEHIGRDADFLQHFKEVERVLKPGGVYAFTTAITFGGRHRADSAQLLFRSQPSDRPDPCPRRCMPSRNSIASCAIIFSTALTRNGCRITGAMPPANFPSRSSRFAAASFWLPT